MSLAAFTGLCAVIVALSLAAPLAVPVIRRSLILHMFGASSSDIRIANVIHRNADGIASQKVFLFPVLKAPRLAVGLVRSVADSWRKKGTSYEQGRVPEAWAAWVAYCSPVARRFDVDDVAALITALAACGLMHAEPVTELLELAVGDAEASAAYVQAVGDVEKALQGLKAGIPAEYAALI